ncbi:MAG: hypothetical protein KatS3mg054_1157 [Chloroflexus sp.]|nr:MAG: hypothetical protein KatS3mg054_1157 [Chloroflexus sp.]
MSPLQKAIGMNNSPPEFSRPSRLSRPSRVTCHELRKFGRPPRLLPAFASSAGREARGRVLSGSAIASALRRRPGTSLLTVSTSPVGTCLPTFSAGVGRRLGRSPRLAPPAPWRRHPAHLLRQFPVARPLGCANSSTFPSACLSADLSVDRQAGPTDRQVEPQTRHAPLPEELRNRGIPVCRHAGRNRGIEDLRNSCLPTGREEPKPTDN